MDLSQSKRTNRIECLKHKEGTHLFCYCYKDNKYLHNLEWVWKGLRGMEKYYSVTENGRKVILNPFKMPRFSVVHGSITLARSTVHYWEIKIASRMRGTNMQIGVASRCSYFFSDRYKKKMGQKDWSWGYSYTGKKLHRGLSKVYGKSYGLGCVIGVELDTFKRTLQFYNNGEAQGIAYRNVECQVPSFNDLYPVVGSSVGDHSIKLITSVSSTHLLEYWCMQVVVNNKNLRHQYEECPAMKRAFDEKYFWMLQL